MPRASRGVLLAVTMALLLAGPLVAQSNTGNVYGNVIDEQGATIPGGTATLIGPSAPMTTSVDAQRTVPIPQGPSRHLRRHGDDAGLRDGDARERQRLGRQEHRRSTCS